MNTNLENIKNSISSKLEEILNDSKTTAWGQIVLANDHKTVLKSDLEKYNALLRMQEIINNNSADLKTSHEFQDLAKIAGISLKEEKREIETNSNNAKINYESKQINAKLEEIVEYAKSSTRGQFSLANDHNSVLKSDLEKYNALLRMQEIINNNYKNQKSKYEYQELAELAGVKLYNAESEKEKQKRIDQNIKEELNNVNNRINTILKESKQANKYQPITIVNNNPILLNYSQEYKALIAMLSYLETNFANMKNDFDYMNLRIQTKLGQMPDEKYFALIGKEEALNKQISSELPTSTKNEEIKLDSNSKKQVEEKNPTPSVIELPSTLENENKTEEKSNNFFSFNIIPEKEVTKKQQETSMINLSTDQWSEIKPKENTHNSSSQPAPSVIELPSKNEYNTKPESMVNNYSTINNKDTQPAPSVIELPSKNEYNTKPENAIDIFSQNLESQNAEKHLATRPFTINLDEPQVEEPKIKVVARRACKWITKHKKQILIAVGISLLMASLIIALQALIPAITSMLQATEVANLSAAMINNGALWGDAIASEQVALHAANTSLASAIETMTGTKALYDVQTGIWTFGGTEITKFATAMGANAANAISQVGAISKGLLATGIAGLGLTGIGSILKNKSSEYKEYLQKIKDLENNTYNFPEGMVEQAHDLINDIRMNSNLNKDEKDRLIRKIKESIKNSYNKLNYFEDALEEGVSR